MYSLLTDPFLRNIICFLIGLCFGMIPGFYIRKRMYFRERLFHIQYIQALERELGIPQDLRRYNFNSWDENNYYEDAEYIITIKEGVRDNK